MWFRRDLRADDNAALYHALKNCASVVCVFVFDTEILDGLPRVDRRVEFIRESLVDLDAQLQKLSGHQRPILFVRHGVAAQEIPQMAAQLGVQTVYTNHDYESSAILRDTAVRGTLANAGISFHTFKDHVIFERDEVLTQSSTPYTVFTPYKNAWLKKCNDFYLSSYPVERYASSIYIPKEGEYAVIPTLAAINFEVTNLSSLKIPTGSAGAHSLFSEFFERLDNYHATRDFPAIKGPSYLGVHLRFGTVSIRKLCAVAHQRVIQGSEGAKVWLSELIWRDFYFSILHHFPRVEKQSFKPLYDTIRWEHGKQAKALFAAWSEGRTGYPLVDAAMHQINQTGYMHNRLRMVVASFLTKDLGIDWRWGERYFAQHLNDFDLAANNGGWQWAASSGCDAQPYFRIFNPVSQSEKFDAQGKFIRRYLPQLAKLPTAALHAPWLASALELQMAGISLGKDYPERIVIHESARIATLARYAVVKKLA